ncbi:MAG TPA: hypothetical protein VLB01_00955 [Thermodesulfobacteriota bacterium]|nr:hypothetical protein [Thermodesulfobacteriota bacterium]
MSSILIILFIYTLLSALLCAVMVGFPMMMIAVVLWAIYFGFAIHPLMGIAVFLIGGGIVELVYQMLFNKSILVPLLPGVRASRAK